MKELLLKLNKLTNITYYLCIISAHKMITVHDGACFEADTPVWMQNFVTGESPVLAFEQNGQRKQYFHWKANADQIVVILDDPAFTNLINILNKMLAALAEQEKAPAAAVPSSAELQVLTEKYQQARLQMEVERKAATRNTEDLEQMKDVMQSLKEQNSDQASRLKDALSKNLDLSHQLKQIKIEEIQGGVSQARGTVTLLRDENSRLTAQVKQGEEKYSKLLDQYNELLKNSGGTAATESYFTDNTSKGLIHVVNALNKVIATADASHIDLKKLALFVTVPAQGELERNPNAVKAIIAKLLGMERSGQLTAFQTKKLNEIVL